MLHTYTYHPWNLSFLSKRGIKNQGEKAFSKDGQSTVSAALQRLRGVRPENDITGDLDKRCFVEQQAWKLAYWVQGNRR
jgi:hypothetical protein